MAGEGRRRRTKPIRRWLLAASAGLLAALVVAMVFLWPQVESRFVFFPTRELESHPGQAGLTYEDVTFPTEGDRVLHGWFVPGRADGYDATWLWLHGNGGNISHRVDELAIVHHRLGVNVLIFDYQGYGRSEGRPTEKGTYQDARNALDYLRNRPDVSADRIIYFGRSLGSAVAVNLAVERPPLGLVLVSPFTSLEDMAKLAFPFLPLEWLTRGKYDSLGLIGKVERPLLVIHGALDSMIPMSQGLRVFEAAKKPKRLQVLQDAGHNDIATSGGEKYWSSLERFMSELAEGAE